MAASNLFGYYSGQGQAMPSLSARGQLYQQYGLGQSTGYSGTASQNTALLNALQGGGGSLGLGASTASTPAPAQSFGTYQPVIDTLTQQAQGLGSIYDPQVTALQASLPTIQQKYSDMLSELSRETGVEQTSLQQQQTGAVGSNQAQAAAAGVAETGGTQERAAQEAIKSQYGTAIANLLAQSASGQQQLGTQQAQEEQGVNQSIASLLGQESTAKANIAGQIAQAQAQYAAQQEQQREFDAQLAATNAQTAATNAQGLSMSDILAALQGGGAGTSATTSTPAIQDVISNFNKTGSNNFDLSGSGLTAPAGVNLSNVTREDLATILSGAGRNTNAWNTVYKQILQLNPDVSSKAVYSSPQQSSIAKSINQYIPLLKGQ